MPALHGRRTRVPTTAAEMGARPARILLVEDERMVAEVVERYLRRDGHSVDVVHDGGAAVAAYERLRPDLVVLDLMLPGVDGIEICREIRGRSATPIIMLTARGEETDKLLGLGTGADDYVTKPFSPRELAARVAVVLRRSAPAASPDETICHGELCIDPAERRVHGPDGPIELTAREFDLLAFLARHPSQVFTRDQLMDAVWEEGFAAEPATVTVLVRRLRAKVERDPSRPRYLKTVWGVGYRFEP